jgi:hypothetical protein
MEWANYLEQGGYIMPMGMLEGGEGKIPDPVKDRAFTLEELRQKEQGQQQTTTIK